jgi:DNA-binding MarR family transcriptional regulator
MIEQPDPIIHPSVRLKIMSALKPLPPAETLEFQRLRGITGATDGNLGAHLATLEQAGYVAIHKDYDGKRPRTRVSMTQQGRGAFDSYLAFLRQILDG